MTEKEIENAILHYLTLRRDVFAWKNQSTGIFDPEKKIFRRSRNVFHIKGVADILGIFRGRPLAIEVKSRHGKPTEAQQDFISRFNKAGGLAFVARSVEEVQKILSE